MDKELTIPYRRWLEVRFYHWCKELFNLRNNLLDVILAVEAISNISDDINVPRIKTLAGTILSDPYLRSSEEELIVLAYEEAEIPFNKIGKHFNCSRSNIKQRYDRIKKKDIHLYPKLNIKDDQYLQIFFNKLDLFKKIGF